MNHRGHQDVAYDIVTVPSKEGPRSFLRFKCYRCPEHADIPRAASGEAGVKWLTQKGWDVDLHRRSHCLCPRCRRRTRGKSNVQETPLKLVTRVNLASDPSPEQRFKIRDRLDKHFDDKAGCYLDGRSDQTIADELEVPRLFVERIRDAAYGPIRITAEMKQIMTDLEAARAEQARLAAVIIDLDRRLVAIGERSAA